MIACRQKRESKEEAAKPDEWRASSLSQMALVAHTLILGLQVNCHQNIVPMMSHTLILNLQLGYKVASRQLVYMLSPCHAVTGLQVNSLTIRMINFETSSTFILFETRYT